MCWGYAINVAPKLRHWHFGDDPLQLVEGRYCDTAYSAAIIAQKGRYHEKNT
jgi:hypothetical protein